MNVFLNVFCMAKRGVSVAYIFINDGWHYFFVNDVSEIPRHIKDFEKITIFRSDGTFCGSLEQMGFTKLNIDVGDGFSTYAPYPNELAIVYNRSANGESTCQAFGGKTGSNPIPVEDVPIGAHITGIENDDGEIDEFSFPVQRIEVSDGFITFLHYWPSKQRTYSYEVSIKRGTRVTYTIK